MATIGRNKAVAQMGRFEFSGIVAWRLWLVVHVLSLVEFRSRMSVLMEWAFAYFTWQRRSRVILEIPRETAAMTMPVEVGRIVSLDEAARGDAELRNTRARARESARH
jgi:hypothetical protein